jgi:hypothetical protein
MSKQLLMIGDQVRVITRHANGVENWTGVLRDLDSKTAYVTRGQETVRTAVPRGDVMSLADRSPAEMGQIAENPIEVHASWQVGVWSWRRFASIDDANDALASLRRSLTPSYIESQSDPLISVGTYSRRGWRW